MLQTMRSLLAAVLLAFALAGCAAAGPAPRATSYANPVLDADFPDPAVLTASDGFYYAFATQGGADGAKRNIQAARSRDLARWETLADALPVKPAWASNTQDFWAPHVSEAAGRYYLYYSAKPDAALADESRGLCLAVATADRPEGPYQDIGKPLLCGPGFVNIDPMAYDDPATGKRLLYWGSGFEPIKVQELGPDRVSFAAGSAPVELVHPVKTQDAADYRRLLEGAWVIRRRGWYYLFYSGDNCCGPKAHYAVLVARSRSATGPFEPHVGAILERAGTWEAPGHNSIVRDQAGEYWMLYHAVDAKRPRTKPTDEVNTRRVMLIDRIVWEDGWPRLEGPSEGPRRAPATRR
jgi:arabinan endo-1,5-alpha-L-arabinosidase